MHDPRLAARRAAAGKTRHPRFTLEVGGETYDRARVPTIAHIIDRAMDVADRARRASHPTQHAHLFNSQAMTCEIRALTLARDCLEVERARRLGAAPGKPDVEDERATPIPPWMQPEAKQ